VKELRERQYPSQVFLWRESWMSSRNSAFAARGRSRLSSSPIGSVTTRPRAIASTQIFSFSGCCRRRSRPIVRSNGHAFALTVLCPVEIVDTFRVTFLPVVYLDPIGLGAAVGGEDDFAEPPAIRGCR